MTGGGERTFLDVQNLREAEIIERGVAQLIISGGTAGDITNNVAIVVAPDDIEILALHLHGVFSGTGASSGATVPALVGREVDSMWVEVSADDDIGTGFGTDVDRDDYFGLVLSSHPSIAWDQGSSTGSGHEFSVIMDPGLDAPDAPLVLREDEILAVHSELLTSNGVSDEMRLQVVLDVYAEEVPEERTEVREDFPSRSGTTV